MEYYNSKKKIWLYLLSLRPPPPTPGAIPSSSLSLNSLSGAIRLSVMD